MSLSDAVSKLSDYLDDSISSANKSIKASSTRSAAQPDGVLKTQLQNQTSASTLDSLKQNPVANAAIDTVNQTVTTVAQQVVRNAISKVNFTPIQNATSQFFTLYASVTSFGTEVAMAFARNTCKNLVKAIADKEKTSQELEAQIVAMYNACAILLAGQPFFDQYLKNVIQAYDLMTTADANLKNVVKVLDSLVSPKYQKVKFNTSITQLTQARDLILPDRGADVSSIQGVKTFVSDTINRQSNKNVYAAAISLPGITVQIGKLVLQYELQSIAVNALINTYVGVLEEYISGYSQSVSINKATIDHINSGLSQLDNLLAEMNTILSTNSGSTTDVKFRAKLSSYGIGWGVQLTGIIEWLKANPGAGSALLTQTGASVDAYNTSTALIAAMGDIPYTGGVLFVNEGREDAFKSLAIPTTKLLVVANTIIATSTSKSNVRTMSQTVKNTLQAGRKSDAKILAAIQPFLNTKSTLSGAVDKAVQNLIGFSNKAGLDRLAGLLTSGSVKDIFSVTPDTATKAGAAVVGLNSILSTLSELPGATTQQINQLESLRNQVQREQKAQEVYAGRVAQLTEEKDAAQRQKKVDNDKVIVQSATETAKQLDATLGDDPAVRTEQMLTPQVTPGGMPSARDLKASLA